MPQAGSPGWTPGSEQEGWLPSPTADGQQLSLEVSTMETPPTVLRTTQKFKSHTPDDTTRALEYDNDTPDTDAALRATRQYDPDKLARGRLLLQDPDKIARGLLLLQGFRAQKLNEQNVANGAATRDPMPLGAATGSTPTQQANSGAATGTTVPLSHPLPALASTTTGAAYFWDDKSPNPWQPGPISAISEMTDPYSETGPAPATNRAMHGSGDQPGFLLLANTKPNDVTRHTRHGRIEHSLDNVPNTHTHTHTTPGTRVISRSHHTHTHTNIHTDYPSQSTTATGVREGGLNRTLVKEL